MSDLLLLCYHAVSERWPAPLAVKPDELEAQLRSLAKRGYKAVTLSEAIAGPDVPRAVVITFDDAYRSVLELARPIVSEAGFTASIFAPTSFIGTEQPMSWPGVEQWLAGEHRAEMVPMSWEELRQLADSGWEVGSHTKTHPRLTQLDDATLSAELRESREQIENLLSRPCRTLAYPYGSYDSRVIEAAQSAGYSGAAGTLPGRLLPPTGAFDWSRIVINRGDSIRRARLKTARVTRWAKRSPGWDVVAAARRSWAVRRAGGNG